MQLTKNLRGRLSFRPRDYHLGISWDKWISFKQERSTVYTLYVYFPFLIGELTWDSRRFS